MTIRPELITWERWSTFMQQDLARFGPGIPLGISDRHWQIWARAVVALPALAGVGAASPDGFTDWREWAHMLNESLRLLGV